MNRRRLARRIAIGLLVGVFAVVGVAVLAPSPAEPAPAPARRVGVGALGTIEPSSRLIALAAPNSASVIARWFVAEGSDVTAGQVLAHTDDHALRQAEHALALDHLATAHAQLARITEGSYPEELRAAEAALQQARERAAQALRDVRRIEELYARGAAPAQELERQRSETNRALAAEAEAASRVGVLARTQEVDLRVRRSEIDAARSAVAVAEAALRRTEIVAPVSGRILRINVRAGEAPGQRSVAELGDTSRMFAAAEVYESDLLQVRIGQPASVRVKSSDLVLRGRVAQIIPLVGRKVALDNDPVTDTDARVVTVRIELAEEDGAKVNFLTNARVEVTIHTT